MQALNLVIGRKGGREIKKLRLLVEVIMLPGHASVESGIEGIKLGIFKIF